MIKKVKYFYGSSRLNLSDEDTITNPSGFVSPEKLVEENLRTLTEEVKKIRKKIYNRAGVPRSQSKPPLFEDTPRYKKYYKLEELFHDVNQESYVKVAMEIGFIKKPSKYSRNKKEVKRQILRLLKTFNKRSKRHWKEILRASRNKAFDGLYLIPVN